MNVLYEIFSVCIVCLCVVLFVCVCVLCCVSVCVCLCVALELLKKFLAIFIAVVVVHFMFIVIKKTTFNTAYLRMYIHT